MRESQNCWFHYTNYDFSRLPNTIFISYLFILDVNVKARTIRLNLVTNFKHVSKMNRPRAQNLFSSVVDYLNI